ncbi:MAG: flagellar filament capping protein FliD [Magnetococcales bacterium]|nr:flagellar filament capping protein FliD [Magnetococcales bacterium]
MGSQFAVGGLASGLPSDIVEQLMQTKQNRLKAYERDVNFYSTQKSAFAELETKLLSLSSISETLQDSSEWAPHTATSSDTDIITAAADSNAIAGTHQVTVSQLASSSTVMSGGGVITSGDTLAALTTFSFDYNGINYSNTTDGTNTPGSGFGIAAGDTLSDIAEKITSYDYEDTDGTDEAGVSASILYDGTNYRLVLAAKDQGAYVRDTDGSTSTSRLENVTVDLSWTTAGNTWDTSKATDSSSISLTGSTSATDAITSIAAGVFEFTYGGVTYDLAGDGTNTQIKDSTGAAMVAGTSTLANLADAITNTVTGMTSSVINNGTTNFLILDGSTAAQAISGVTTAMTVGTTAINTYSSSFFESDEGQDAKLTVDGLSNIYSSSNIVDEVLPGVAMTVASVTTSAISVTVADDTDTLKETLTSFTTAYNDVISYINSQKEGAFAGSTLARSVISLMRSVINTSTHKDDGTGDIITPYSILAEMGLRTNQQSGQISFDSTQLDDALTNSFTVMTKIFTNTQNDVGSGNNAGVAYRFEDLIDELTDSVNGSITGRDDGLQARIDSLETSIERENRRLDIVRERLTKQFSNLEQLVNSMNASGSALTNALSGLN